MKRLILAALALALTLPGCSSLGTASHIVAAATSSQPLGDFTVLDDKAMYAAEALYNVPASAYRSADTRGLIPAHLKAVIKPKLQTMGRVLKTARSAYRIGDLTSFNARYRALLALKDEVTPLIPRVTP